MFETMSLLALQQYWWAIISLLAGFLVFLMFVQGGQTLVYTLGRNNEERTLVVNTLGRKWEFTFTTLVTFGGAFFASFPLFYSTSFGGAYWVWMLILLCFVLQAIAYEYRSKPGNLYGHRVYEMFLLFNGAVGTILIGTAVATFFNGSPFSLSNVNFSKWESPWHGIEAVFNMHNLTLGIAVFFLTRVLALLYFMNHIDHLGLFERSKKLLKWNVILFLAFFIAFIVILLFKSGFAYDAITQEVYMEKYKYFNNFVQMPVTAAIFLSGVVFVLYGIYKAMFKSSTKAIWFAGSGTILTVFALFIIAGYNNTAFYPSTFNLQNSLTIENSSSSHYTLVAMSYVSLLVPFVLVYIYFTWRAINKKKISFDDLKSENHVY